MKTLITFFLLLIFTFDPSATIGQTTNLKTSSDETLVQISRMINLENDSKDEEISLEVKQNGVRLDININARLFQGKIDIEVYSPSGEKTWNLTVGNQTDSYRSEQVSGTITKRMKDPNPGTWVLKLKPENATGSVNIDSRTTEN